MCINMSGCNLLTNSTTFNQYVTTFLSQSLGQTTKLVFKIILNGLNELFNAAFKALYCTVPLAIFAPFKIYVVNNYSDTCFEADDLWCRWFFIYCFCATGLRYYIQIFWSVHKTSTVVFFLPLPLQSTHEAHINSLHFQLPVEPKCWFLQVQR